MNFWSGRAVFCLKQLLFRVLERPWIVPVPPEKLYVSIYTDSTLRCESFELRSKSTTIGAVNAP